MGDQKLILKKEYDHSQVFIVENTKTGIVQAKGSYITIQEFKEAFTYTGELVKLHQLDKLIFDKRTLSVFHQPSMEWYFTEWKEQMFEHGLTRHRKILPNDEVFNQSVKIGRESINKKHPKGKFHLMDIKYCDSLEEAILN